MRGGLGPVWTTFLGDSWETVCWVDEDTNRFFVLAVTAQKTVDTTIWTTVKPTASAADGGSGGELSRSDKIALGVGIGIGLPSAVAGIWVCCMGIMRR